MKLYFTVCITSKLNFKNRFIDKDNYNITYITNFINKSYMVCSIY